jgi:hypothetical protein
MTIVEIIATNATVVVSIMNISATIRNAYLQHGRVTELAIVYLEMMKPYHVAKNVQAQCFSVCPEHA